MKNTEPEGQKANEEQAESPSKAYRVLSVVRTIFILLLAAGIIIAALLFASSRTPDKSLFGYRYYTVLTPSMEPAYSVGDMVFVKLAKADEINVGDIITFNPSSDSDAYLTHRVTQKLTDYQGTGVTCFKTKGDANDSEDSFLIDEGRVIGVVKFGIPKLGTIVRFIQLRWYFIVPLIILVFVFFKLIGIYLSSPKEKAAEDGREAPEAESGEPAGDEASSSGETAGPAEAGSADAEKKDIDISGNTL